MSAAYTPCFSLPIGSSTSSQNTASTNPSGQASQITSWRTTAPWNPTCEFLNPLPSAVPYYLPGPLTLAVTYYRSEDLFLPCCACVWSCGLFLILWYHISSLWTLNLYCAILLLWGFVSPLSCVPVDCFLKLCHSTAWISYLVNCSSMVTPLLLHKLLIFRLPIATPWNDQLCYGLTPPLLYPPSFPINAHTSGPEIQL